jgi:hypothetical protein
MPFQYTPHRNQYVGSITDLMGRGRDAEAQALITAANAQAQAAQASGQAWGGAVQGIGNTIAAIPGQMQAQQDRDRVIEERDRADRTRAMTASILNHPSQIGPTIPDGTLLPANGQQPDLYIPSTPGAAVEGPKSMAGDFKGMVVAEGLELPNPFTTKDANGSSLFDPGKIGSAYIGAGLDIPEKTMEIFARINRSITGQFDESVKNAENLALQYLEGDPRVWGEGIKAAVKVFTDNGLFPPEQMASITKEVEAIEALPETERRDAEERLLRRLGGDRADTAFGQNLYDVTLADGTFISGASQVDGPGGDRFYVDPNGNRLRDVAGVREQQYINYGGAGGAAGSGTITTQGVTFDPGDYDPQTQNMLDHAGLTLPVFMVVIGKTSSLARGRTRTEAIEKASLWLREKGIDPSTMETEYKNYNEALGFNIRKYNLVRGAESEIYQDIQNIRSVVDRMGLSEVNVLNQFKIGVERQFNDPNMAEYIFYINQIQSNFALLNWASQGGSGQGVTDAIMRDSKAIISAGASHGTLDGLFRGLRRSVRGMANVNREAVNRTRGNVWNLFNVREHYDPIRLEGDTLPYIETLGTDGTGGTGTPPTGADGFDPYTSPPAVRDD